MLEWIRFILTAVLLLGAVFSFAAAVLGVSRFEFVLNRLHAAGIGDTLGLLLVVAALVVASGIGFESLKLILLIFFMWFTSPVSTHFVAQVEYFTNRYLEDFVHFKGEIDLGTDADGDR